MIRELKTLVAIAREGTFSAAGAKVGLTQAAVSAQMQRLEAELGYPLFERNGRSATLNARGQRTLVQAHEMLRLHSRVGMNDASTDAERPLDIGAIASVQQSVLPAALARLRKRLPSCRARVVPGVSSHLLDRVDAGDIEWAAIIHPPYDLAEELHWTPLAHEPFRLLVHRSVKGEDWSDLLQRNPFIRYDRNSFGGRQVDRFIRAAQIEVQEACELDELEAIVRLVALRVGVALVPQTAAQARWPRGVRAVDLGPHSFYREIGIVHRALPLLGMAARQLMDELRGAVAPAPHEAQNRSHRAAL